MGQATINLNTAQGKRARSARERRSSESTCRWFGMSYSVTMNKPNMLDLYFGDARSKLIELAAFFDRIEREGSESMSDFRLLALRDGLAEILKDDGTNRTERIQNLWSDPTMEPIPEAHTKAAIGVRPDYSSAENGK